MAEQMPLLVEPQRQQRLHEKPGAEGIHAEQRGEPVNKPLGLAQWLVGCRFRLDCRRQRPVQHQRDEPEHGIADKHQLHDGDAADAPIRGQIGDRRCEDAERTGERPDNAVTRKDRGAPPRLGGLRQRGLLERQEDAGIARGRVHRADKRDEQQRPEGRRHREPGAGRDHQQRGGEQQAPHRIAVGDHPGPQRHQRRADQRRGNDCADLQCAEAELQQIDRHEQRDAPVAEGAQPACGKDAQAVACAACRDCRPVGYHDAQLYCAKRILGLVQWITRMNAST